MPPVMCFGIDIKLSESDLIALNLKGIFKKV